MSETLSRRLAAWFARLTWQSLPQQQQELARSRVLDTLGLAICGAQTEATSIARALALRSSGAGRASLAGSSVQAPAAWAALVNGIAAHCYDFDDTFPESVVHPGSAIVPVALAIGEETGASGAEILTAIAGGYEIVARLGRAGERRFHERGFHATGIFAPVGAAFVAARLLGLDAPTTASAVGLAASMSGGLLAFLPDGAWSKWLHLGWGNFGGITAAQLAQGGFRGPAGALDGRHNLFEAFIGESHVDADAIAAQLGERWDSATAVFKLYPCAHVIQGYIDLALAMRNDFALDPAAIDRITCTVAPWAVPIVCEPVAEKINPQSIMHSIASLPLHVASAFIDGRVDLATIADAQRARPDVLALAAKVVYVADGSLDRFDARIAVVTAGGARHERHGAVAEPDARRLGEKFAAITGGTLGADEAAAARVAVARLAAAPGPGEVTRYFRRPAPSAH